MIFTEVNFFRFPLQPFSDLAYSHLLQRGISGTCTHLGDSLRQAEILQPGHPTLHLMPLVKQCPEKCDFPPLCF